MGSDRRSWGGARHIGVDVGGSGARLWRVHNEGELWRVEGQGIRLEWELSAWVPVPLDRQLDGCDVLADEQREATRRLDRIAGAVEQLGGCTQLALAVPGLRSSDGRGVLVARNGPRIPDLLGGLEQRIGLEGSHLCGDGLAGAAGELRGVDGALRGVGSGLYLGGGTGLAEALVVGGQVSELGADMPKAWRVEVEGGRTLEDSLAPFHMRRDPELLDAQGELVAQRIWPRLAAYVALRRAQFASAFGAPLERIVVAQGLARLLRKATLPGEDWERHVVLSNLSAAPALGAVALAAAPDLKANAQDNITPR
jgi:hypothetical protein